MGAPMGNRNAAHPHRGVSAGAKRYLKKISGRKYPRSAKGIYGEKVKIYGITGHSAITNKGSYHTSKLFKSGSSIWRKRGY
jgi:hypothetical protein